MDCLNSSLPCSQSDRADAAVICAGDIVLSGNVPCIMGRKHIIMHTCTMQGVVSMVAFNWLVLMVPTQLRGGWSTAVMDCGELSATLTQEMVKWCVENSDTKILVSFAFLLVNSWLYNVSMLIMHRYYKFTLLVQKGDVSINACLSGRERVETGCILVY